MYQQRDPERILKLCGTGEWLLNTKTRRSWLKLHISLDADTGQIVAAALTTEDVDDGADLQPRSAPCSIKYQNVWPRSLPTARMTRKVLLPPLQNVIRMQRL